MDIEIAKAVTVFRNSPELADEQIYQALVNEGFERRLAARLVEFLPSAYCRAILEHTGWLAEVLNLRPRTIYYIKGRSSRTWCSHPQFTHGLKDGPETEPTLPTSRKPWWQFWS